jgi:small subunit ribosomal protein S9
MATKLTKKNSKPIKPVKNQVATKTNKKTNFIRGLGRRRTAIARARVFEGKEEIVVNHKPISTYWPNRLLASQYLEPFRVTNTLDKYTAEVLIAGGGVKGQINAFIHAVSKALSTINPEKFRPILKKNGFLTRDPRMKETRKVGQAGKARLKKQSPKR